jgi:predicted DNA-binding transcriptional regulator AlpA
VANRPAGDPPKGYLWLKQAAVYIGYAPSTLYKWRQEAFGPEGEVIGRRRIAYKIAELDRFLGHETSPSDLAQTAA